MSKTVANGLAYFHELLMAQDFFLAWGTGNAGWGSSPPEPSESDTALYAHLGHFPATAVYCEPDEEGELATSSGERFTASGSPTPFLFISAPYDFTHEASGTIRELALYMNADPDTGHEAQTYLPAADLASLGELIAIQRIAPITRSGSTDGMLKMVHEFANDA